MKARRFNLYIMNPQAWQNLKITISDSQFSYNDDLKWKNLNAIFIRGEFSLFSKRYL